MIKYIARCIPRDRDVFDEYEFRDALMQHAMSTYDIESEFNMPIEDIISLAYTTTPPNKISMIVELERVRAVLGDTPTKQEFEENSSLIVSQYDDEFVSWEHLLDRLDYDPWYRDKAKTTLPTFENIMLPLLEFLSDSHKRDYSEVTNYLASYFKLTQKSLKIQKPSGGSYFYNKIGWAKTYLTRAGVLQKKAKVFQISTLGLDVLKQKPPRIDRAFLHRLSENALHESESDKKHSQNQNIHTAQEPSHEEYMNRLNCLIDKMLRLVKSSQSGAYMSDIRMLLDISQEEMSGVTTRLIRIDGVSKKEIVHDGMLKDILFRYDEPVDDIESNDIAQNEYIEQTSVQTTDSIDVIAQQMIDQYYANRKLDKSLQHSLTMEYLKSRSIESVIENHPDLSEKDIRRHVRTPLRLPDELRVLNETGLHPDPKYSLYIALFATDHYQWNGEKDVEENVIHMAKLLSRYVMSLNKSPSGKYEKSQDGIKGGTLSTAIAVWIAVATLHKEHGMDTVFSKQLITDKMIQQKLCNVSYKTISVHISSHCVANAPTTMSAVHRKLYRVGPGAYRLYKRGESCHPTRERCKIAPLPIQMSDEYKDLRRWYDEEYCRANDS